MEYSISGVKSKDMAKVFAAIEDIEELIEGENNNAGGVSDEETEP